MLRRTSTEKKCEHGKTSWPVLAPENRASRFLVGLPATTEQKTVENEDEIAKILIDSGAGMAEGVPRAASPAK